MHTLRFRQVHLDFHTSPAIEGIGAAFDPRQWQDSLRQGHVNSITCFAVCHHGWHYHDTRVGRRHPHLAFDLLRAQYDAAKAIGVNVPVYISAGVNNRVAEERPEWREIGPDGRFTGWTASPLEAGFKSLCFNSPYTDYLCDTIRETVSLFPDCDGIFLDIISQRECCCETCLRAMHERGLDPRKPEDRRTLSNIALERYYRMATDACRAGRADMPVFHNSGHIPRGERRLLPYFSHLELESLPTGGWGYDHFPVSAKYCKNLQLDFLGMTGKFHTTWGEFGGYKHPNALRYECAAMLAFGAKCSVGDQAHPSGRMDDSTYAIIGAAYAEVEAKEPWCTDTRNRADVAVLSSAAMNPAAGRDSAADDGAARVLLEGGFLFDFIDGDMPFDAYRAIVLPDDVRVDADLKHRLDAFLGAGGRLLLSGRGGMWRDRDEFAFDIGAAYEGVSPFQPDYAAPEPRLAPDFARSPFVMVMRSQRIRVRPGTNAESLGRVYDPYFNRTYRHFCSHQHAPPRPEPSGYDCATLCGPVLYLAHPVFSQYRATGAVALRQYAVNALRLLLGDRISLRTNLPSTARVSLMRQAAHDRDVLHLLYAPTVNRGGVMRLSEEGYVRNSTPVEVIEDLPPLHDTRISLAPARKVRGMTLAPGGTAVPFSEAASGRVEFTIPSFACHQMVVIQY